MKGYEINLSVSRFFKPNKCMEAFFATIFADVKQERSLKLILLLEDPETLKQSKNTDPEINIGKNLGLEKMHRHFKSCCTNTRRVICFSNNVYSNLKNEDTTLLKITSKVVEINELKNQTERYENENISKPLKLHDDNFNRKKIRV